MCTIGDPLMDLGTTLAYWTEAGDAGRAELAAGLDAGPTALPGSLTRRELAERYAEATGCDVSSMLFYYCFGLFKLAVIAQQIYARFVRGTTSDRRFARLDAAVSLLGRIALEATRSGRY